MIIGPESTGKSTLSAALAEQLKTVWVPEYARSYLRQQDNKYTFADLLQIAEGQLKAEDEAATVADRYLVCDTDLYVIKVWSEHSYGTVDARILQYIAARHYDLYLLCDIDMPWTRDEQREYPEPEMRHYFYHVYRDLVQQSGTPWTLVSGNEPQRLQKALDAVQALG